jgi:thiamine transport system ATP-binding protein
MIELDGVVYRYDPMVMRFDIAVEAGAFVAMIGPSGAGKSTLINLIAGFEAPESGRIRLDGRDRTEARPADRPVTTLFQDHNLFAHLNAGDNVGLGLHPGLRLSRADRARVAEALAEVGLAGLENRRPAALSGGERQRVALARSIVRERPILLLDEPFAALDPALRREMTALVDRLRRERGLTVVMVSHQLDEVMDVASRALFLHDGRIVADGPLRAMIEAPPTPEVARYVA